MQKVATEKFDILSVPLNVSGIQKKTVKFQSLVLESQNVLDLKSQIYKNT